MAQRGMYRKLPKKRCIGCDHPSWAPSKRINPDRACTKCIKNATAKKPREKWDSRQWE